MSEKPISMAEHRDAAKEVSDLLKDDAKFSQLPKDKLKELQNFLQKEPRRLRFLCM